MRKKAYILPSNRSETEGHFPVHKNIIKMHSVKNNLLSNSILIASILSLLVLAMAIFILQGPNLIHPNSQNKEVLAELNSLQRQINDIRSSGKDNISPEKQVKSIRLLDAKIDKLESDLQNLKKLLSSNPNSTTTIPVVMNDLKNLRKENDNLNTKVSILIESVKWCKDIIHYQGLDKEPNAIVSQSDQSQEIR